MPIIKVVAIALSSFALGLTVTNLVYQIALFNERYNKSSGPKKNSDDSKK